MIELFKFGYSPVTSFTIINLLLNFSSPGSMGGRTENNKFQTQCMLLTGIPKCSTPLEV